MIIKSERVATSASRTRLANHLFRGRENSAIVVLRGSERDLADLFRDARQHGARYGVRHWIIAPLLPATREQVFCILDLLAGEFRFEPKAAIRDVARARTVIFRGEPFGYSGKIVGTAYAFKRGCPPASYAVSGEYSPDNTTIVLRGAAPIRQGCAITGYPARSPHAVLRFKSLMS